MVAATTDKPVEKKVDDAKSAEKKAADKKEEDIVRFSAHFFSDFSFPVGRGSQNARRHRAHHGDALRRAITPSNRTRSTPQYDSREHNEHDFRAETTQIHASSFAQTEDHLRRYDRSERSGTIYVTVAGILYLDVLRRRALCSPYGRR